MKCTRNDNAIRRVGADGRLDAVYSNPKPLPFAKAEATAGVTLRAFSELRSGCYDPSTCELACDTATDRIKGICYQAVAKRKFEVVLTRKRPDRHGRSRAGGPRRTPPSRGELLAFARTC